MRSHFRLARRDELVDDHLRAVGEIAELRLPQRQRVRLGQRVAVLEAEHGLLRQHRVDDLEAALPVGEVLERDVAVLVSWSNSTAWRCENVPRSTSWPDRRTALPSARIEPNASDSAVAQSIPTPVSIAFCRLSRKRRMVRWTWKSPASSTSFAPMSLSSARSTPVSPRRGSSHDSAVLRPLHAPSSQSALFGR